MAPDGIPKLTCAATTGYSPPEPSELVKQITKLERDFKEAKSELDQIRATLFINYGSGYRNQDGITFDKPEKSTLVIMCEVLRAYSLKVAGEPFGDECFGVFAHGQDKASKLMEDALHLTKDAAEAHAKLLSEQMNSAFEVRRMTLCVHEVVSCFEAGTEGVAKE